MLRKMWQFIVNLFSKKHSKKTQLVGHPDQVEPKYWPEVVDFMETLNTIIDSHTIEDSNIQIINQRIVDYVQEQINIKGSLDDIEQRYLALDTLADRILVRNLSRIVGLKQNESTRAEFSEAIEHFKHRLHQRHQHEIASHHGKQ
ncbi:MAG: hypothetical protein ACHQJ6_02385 [Candidatus Berkiellales bacterium]